jgi:hypothetical protein
MMFLRDDQTRQTRARFVEEQEGSLGSRFSSFCFFAAVDNARWSLLRSEAVVPGGALCWMVTLGCPGDIVSPLFGCPPSLALPARQPGAGWLCGQVVQTLG